MHYQIKYCSASLFLQTWNWKHTVWHSLDDHCSSNFDKITEQIAGNINSIFNLLFRALFHFKKYIHTVPLGCTYLIFWNIWEALRLVHESVWRSDPFLSHGFILSKVRCQFHQWVRCPTLSIHQIPHTCRHGDVTWQAKRFSTISKFSLCKFKRYIMFCIT